MIWGNNSPLHDLTTIRSIGYINTTRRLLWSHFYFYVYWLTVSSDIQEDNKETWQDLINLSELQDHG